MRRPKIRGDCIGGPRPCPWVGCKHHLGIDVSPTTGHMRVYEGWEDRETCTLDLAERGGMDLKEIGDLAGVSRQAVEQMIKRVFVQARLWLENRDITPESTGADDLEAARAAASKDWLTAPGELQGIEYNRHRKRWKT